MTVKVHFPRTPYHYRTVAASAKADWLAMGWLAESPDPLWVDPDKPAEPEPEPEPPADEGDDDRPRGNASRAEWETYAESVGVEVTEDMSRDDIREAVAAAEG